MGKRKEAFSGIFFFLNDSSYRNCLTIVEWQFMDCNWVIQDLMDVICLFIPDAVPAVPRVVTKVLELLMKGEMCPRTLLQLVQQT